MHVASTRFGNLEVAEEAILTFPDGMIGLSGAQYALVAQGDDSPFFWLQSTETPEVALPVTIPWLFFADYDVRVHEDDARRLDLGSPAEADILCVVRAAEDPRECSVNLAAPVLVNRVTRVARQIINDAGGYSVRQPLLSEVDLSDVPPAATPPSAKVAAV